LGKLLAFIEINTNGEVSLTEPYLAVKKTDKTKSLVTVNHHAHRTNPIVNLNGNEILRDIEICLNKESVATTGFQQCIIRLKHES
jgi:hypothetical protein